MCLLAIETATSSGSYAILRDGKIIYQDIIDMRTTHSETIMVRVDDALKALKIDKKEIEGICVSNGPGSFTGCRIGLATAKGISTGLRIPLVAFDTLEVLAANAYGTDKNILSVIDARMNEAYVGVYDSSLGIIKGAHCRPYGEITNDLTGDYICVGDVHLVNDNARFKKALAHQNVIQASAMFSLMQLKGIEMVYDQEYIFALEPYYVRSAFAQVNKK